MVSAEVRPKPVCRGIMRARHHLAYIVENNDNGNVTENNVFTVSPLSQTSASFLARDST